MKFSFALISVLATCYLHCVATNDSQPIQSTSGGEFCSSDSRSEESEIGSSTTKIDEPSDDGEDTEPRLKFPSFSHRFGGLPWETTFTLRYNFIMSLGDISITFEAHEAHEARGAGRLDLRHNNEYIRLWLTGDNKTLIEQVSSGKCKRIRQLHQFLRLDAFIDAIQGDQQSRIGISDSNFAVANLWELFSSRMEIVDGQEETSSGRVGYNYRNEAGQKLAEWSIHGPRASVVFSFGHETLGSGSLKLQTISLQSHGDVLESVTLEMLEMYEWLLMEDMHLPVECAASLNNEQFPKLSDLLATTNGTLHMRSELTTHQALEGGGIGGGVKTEIFLLDEHFDQNLGAFRSRSSGLKRNFDYLVFNDTREFFDLSDNFTCNCQPPCPDSPNATTATDWILDNLFHADHDGSFYGPLSLWLFAERPQLWVEPMFDDFDLMDLRSTTKINYWYSKERWRVFQPLEQSLQYTLQFSRDTSKQGSSMMTNSSYVVLDQVETMNWFLSMIGEKPQLIQAEVVYGRETLNPRELLIPKGHGCRRNQLAQSIITRGTTDLLLFDPLGSVEFEYEASLSVVDHKAGGTLKPKPVVHSGWFGGCPGYNWEWFASGVLKVNHQRIHHFNGTLESHKWVLSNEASDPQVTHRRLLNEKCGVCSIWQEDQAPFEVFRLDFSQEQKEDPIVIDDCLFKLLSTESYELDQIQTINSTNSGGDLITEVVYEKRINNFTLNRQISGPTSIIRTFRRSSSHPQWGRPYYIHSSVTLEAMVLGTAHLTLRFKRLSSIDCIDILDKASAEDCYQSTELSQGNSDSQSPRVLIKLRSFTMKMLLINSTLNKSNGLEVLLKRAFVGALLKMKVGLKPMQIGRVHFDQEHFDKRVHVNFNLMEPPAAIEYFTKISDKMIKASRSSNVSQSMVRLSNSQISCSEWCDTWDCVAFSYCQLDRTCLMIKPSFTILNLFTNDPYLEEVLGIQLDDENSCDYYFAPSAERRQSLDKVIKHIGTQVERFNGTNFVQGFTFELPVHQNRVQLIAYEFTEITRNIELLDEQSAIANQNSEPTAGSMYTMLSSQRALGPDKFAETLISSLRHTNTMGECLESCSRESCQLLSYCGQQQVCTILKNITDGPTLRQMIEHQSSEPPNHDCNTYSLDFLLYYREFENTTKPVSHAHLIENITALECAAICELGLGSSGEQFNCLSFDYCLNFTTENVSGCYLQKMHVLMDSFDESILEQRSINAVSHNTSQCSHYSKSLFADFDWLQGRKFVEHGSIVFKGTELDQCALICWGDEACLAFEYCYRELDKPQNSCYIRRRNDETETTQTDYKADELMSDTKCSVYRTKYVNEEFQVDFGKFAPKIIGVYEPNYVYWLTEIGRGNFKSAIEIIIFTVTLFGAMVIGSLVHIMYIIITGDRLPIFD